MYYWFILRILKRRKIPLIPQNKIIKNIQKMNKPQSDQLIVAGAVLMVHCFLTWKYDCPSCLKLKNWCNIGKTWFHVHNKHYLPFSGDWLENAFSTSFITDFFSNSRALCVSVEGLMLLKRSGNADKTDDDWGSTSPFSVFITLSMMKPYGYKTNWLKIHIIWTVHFSENFFMRHNKIKPFEILIYMSQNSSTKEKQIRKK